MESVFYMSNLIQEVAKEIEIIEEVLNRIYDYPTVFFFVFGLITWVIFVGLLIRVRVEEDREKAKRGVVKVIGLLVICYLLFGLTALNIKRNNERNYLDFSNENLWLVQSVLDIEANKILHNTYYGSVFLGKRFEEAVSCFQGLCQVDLRKVNNREIRLVLSKYLEERKDELELLKVKK